MTQKQILQIIRAALYTSPEAISKPTMDDMVQKNDPMIFHLYTLQALLFFTVWRAKSVEQAAEVMRRIFQQFDSLELKLLDIIEQSDEEIVQELIRLIQAGRTLSRKIKHDARPRWRDRVSKEVEEAVDLFDLRHLSLKVVANL